MLLLLADAILLIFITLSLGILTRECLSRLFRSPLQTDLLELFLLGLLSSSIYFNILSFFRPVNHWTVIPLILLAVGTLRSMKTQTRAVGQSIRNNLRLFFSPRHWPLTLILGIVLLVYWVLPCGTDDSHVYHFQSILWYEKFKVVPGLGNLNGRLAFNPAAFLIESAYSFSSLVGQPLYPLNGVAALFLYAWLLLRVLRTGRSLTALLYTALIILVSRHTLIDITSPSSDLISVIGMLYVLVRLAEYSLSTEKTLARTIVPALIIVYALTIKTATFALLLVLPYLFFTLPKGQKRIRPVLQTALIGLLIYLPWLGRNYILSGYLVFPIPFTGWFHPDWKIPAGALQMEINYIHILPKIENDFSAAAFSRARTLVGWIPYWVHVSLELRTVDILCFCIALLSPLYWGIRWAIKRTIAPLFLPWGIAFLATLIWVQTAPVFRYGQIYIYMSFLLPAFDCAYLLSNPTARSAPLLRRSPVLIGMSLLLSGIYFLHIGIDRPTTYKFSLTDVWLKPLKAIWYDDRQKASFPDRTLKNGTKMYVGDDGHLCINACLPCMEFNYGAVEMRGDSLDQGFKTVHDEVSLHYPQFLQ